MYTNRSRIEKEAPSGQDRGSASASQVAALGFTLTELMIVVGIIGLLAAIAVPNFARAREASWRNICVSNLRAMEAAKAQAALELKWRSTTGPATMGNPLYKDTVAQYLQKGVRPVCPSGVDCYFNAIYEKATCTSGLPGHEI